MKDLVAFHRGDIIGERDGVEVRKAVHGNGRNFDAWTSLMEPFEEVLSDSTKIGRHSCMDLLARLSAFGRGDKGIAEGHHGELRANGR